MDNPDTPYEMLGGNPVIAAIVTRFYDLVESDPAYRDLRIMHAGDLSDVRHGLTRFLAGWLGGPRDWFEKGGCVMSMHRPLDITPDIAKQWTDAMTCALKTTPTANDDVAHRMADALGQMARGMINRAQTKADVAAE